MTDQDESTRKKKKLLWIALQGIVMGVITTLELRARKSGKPWGR